ncbi:CHRD domain-containing protein [Paenalkalicoccus suaedae]|uniref:CHRD domain-containing protein n=1 Tax=Paenalkalicoccus suaedae TaxID=2592382 RepID=A0A859FCM6_9BACI|nr:CHRD domain-containing protein [Paenalkalicoccus suaedae]QKS70015.1 CHRD domain-containing protein [Paenalkalicoccus suaedae]
MKKSLIVSTASIFAFTGFMGAVSAAHEGQSFMAEMTPDQEVHDVDSDASGHIHIQVSEDGESLDFEVEAYDLTGTMAGHLHSGAAGENGPVELFLFENDEPMDYDGEVASGTLSADDLVGELSWEEFSMALVAGDIYANLHTDTYPDGEIRGQLMSDGDEAEEGDAMPNTASNGLLYTMLGMGAALGGVVLLGRRKRVAE